MTAQSVSLTNKPVEKPLNLWVVLKRTAPLIVRVCPLYFAANQGVAIAHGLIWGVETWARQLLFDSVTGAVGGTGAVGTVLWMAVLLSLVAIGAQVLNGVHNFLSGALFQRIEGPMQGVVHKKTARLDPVVFEDPASLDHINKAVEGAKGSGGLLFTVLTLFTFYLPYFFFMSVYLYRLKPILVLTIVLVFLPNLLTNLVRSLVFAKLEDESAPLRRRMEAYEEALCGRAAFKETRALGGYGFFTRLYRETIDLLNRTAWKAERRTNLMELGLKIVTLLGGGVIIWMLLDALRAGEISVGAFAAVFSSINMLFGVMEEIVCRHLGAVVKNMSTVRNFVRFLDLPERAGEARAMDAGQGVDMENVSFRYPGAEQDSLRNVSLAIRPGETIAVVGENGAGKSTLVRLLVGLYVPQSGRVRIGGCDTASVAPASLWRGISGVFQKYQRYQLTLRENVDLSDPEQHADAGKAVQAAGLALEDGSFPEGIETMLSREFDGVDLSGGQWQRVAIARGLYRAHNMIVLDEPTAAIDPIEETHVYQRFAELAKDATALIVTHRLGSARIADRIVVMEAGHIVEEGTHAVLIRQNGVYARMWDAQAQWYA